MILERISSFSSTLHIFSSSLRRLHNNLLRVVHDSTGVVTDVQAIPQAMARSTKSTATALKKIIIFQL